MSLSRKHYTTTEAKARRVIACCGKAPVVLREMDADELKSLAALCDDRGRLVADGREKFRLLMVEHYDRLKASDADFDSPPTLLSE